MRRHLLALASVALAASANAQTATPAATPAGAAKQQELVCKRFLETGSLVKGRRECKTRADWERERDSIRTPSPTSGSCASANSGTCNG